MRFDMVESGKGQLEASWVYFALYMVAFGLDMVVFALDLI